MGASLCVRESCVCIGACEDLCVCVCVGAECVGVSVCVSCLCV